MKKSLGVMVDEKLNWDEQFKHTEGKTSGGLAALKKVKNVLPQSQLCNVCCPLIESHLRYNTGKSFVPPKQPMVT